MSAEVSDNWVQLQVNVFTRWVQNQLKVYPDVHIDSITKDLSNGVALVDLAKTLTQKDTPRSWSSSPKRTVDMVQNCDLAVDMFTKDGVNLVGISGKDINDNKEKLILGLIWSLILHYSIGRSVQTTNDNSKHNSKEDIQKEVKNEIKQLKSWAVDRIENYPNIHNFSPYELSMCALLDSYVPNKINYYSLNPNDTEHNSNLATGVMKDLGIPILIYPDDIKNSNSKVDDKTLLTQLSCMKSVLESSASHIISKEGSKKDEKSDVESDSDDQIEGDFENTLPEENELNNESIIKGESALQNNQANELNNHQSTNDFDLTLFKENSFDHESQIKTASVQTNQQLQHKDIDLSHVNHDHDQNKMKYSLTDHLLDKDSILKVDSRNDDFINENHIYERLQDHEVHMNFFERFIQRFIDSVVRFFNPPEIAGPTPRGRAFIISSPITPYIYSIDYNNQ